MKTAPLFCVRVGGGPGVKTKCRWHIFYRIKLTAWGRSPGKRDGGKWGGGGRSRREARTSYGHFMIIYTKACDRWGSTYTLRQTIIFSVKASVPTFYFGNFEALVAVCSHRTKKKKHTPFPPPPPASQGGVEKGRWRSGSLSVPSIIYMEHIIFYI